MRRRPREGLMLEYMLEVKGENGKWVPDGIGAFKELIRAIAEKNLKGNTYRVLPLGPRKEEGRA